MTEQNKSFNDLLKTYHEDIKRLKKQIQKLKKEYKQTHSPVLLAHISVREEMLSDLNYAAGRLENYYDKEKRQC